MAPSWEVVLELVVFDVLIALYVVLFVRQYLTGYISTTPPTYNGDLIAGEMVGDCFGDGGLFSHAQHSGHHLGVFVWRTFRAASSYCKSVLVGCELESSHVCLVRLIKRSRHRSVRQDETRSHVLSRGGPTRRHVPKMTASWIFHSHLILSSTFMCFQRSINILVQDSL